MSTLEKKVDIITSQRSFGIEIESGNKSDDALETIHRAISGWVRITTDSSITLPNAREFVTNVLQGKKGAGKVVELCKNLQALDYITDDISCGMHVHLDAKEFLNKKECVYVEKDIDKLITARADDLDSVYYISKEAVRPFGNGKIDTPNPFIGFVESVGRTFTDRITSLGSWISDPVYVIKDSMDVGGVKYDLLNVSEVDKYDEQIASVLRNKEQSGYDMEYNKMKQEGTAKTSWIKDKKKKALEKYNERILKMFSVKDGRYVVVMNDDKPLKRVKALMYFYIAYNKIFQGMVAPSRKDGNAYCMPISDFFELEQVEKLKKYSDFEKMWYKDEDDGRISRFKTDHYNDSRYLDVNLHCLWNRTNTIELRLHGSTKDPNQILLWTALHQLIVDKMATEITMEMVKESIEGVETIEEKYEAMVRLLQLPETLQTYVKRLLNHFSDLNIK